MALATGTVSINPTTGAVSGSGYARELYDAEGASNAPLLGDLDAAVVGLLAGFGSIVATDPDFQPGGSSYVSWRANVLGGRQGMASKCNALAAAHAAFIQTGTVVVPPGAGGGTFPVL